MTTIKITKDTIKTAKELEFDKYSPSFFNWLSDNIDNELEVFNVWYDRTTQEEYATVDLCVEVPTRGSILKGEDCIYGKV